MSNLEFAGKRLKVNYELVNKMLQLHISTRFCETLYEWVMSVPHCQLSQPVRSSPCFLLSWVKVLEFVLQNGLNLVLYERRSKLEGLKPITYWKLGNGKAPTLVSNSIRMYSHPTNQIDYRVPQYLPTMNVCNRRKPPLDVC